MSPDPPHQELDETTMRRLAQLADGSLRGWERAEFEAEVAHSPTLRAALERQRAGAGALRGLDLEASPGLRARIAAKSTQSRPTRRPRLWIPGALAGAVAAAALAAVVILPSGGESPTVVQAARLAQYPAGGQVGGRPFRSEAPRRGRRGGSLPQLGPRIRLAGGGNARRRATGTDHADRLLRAGRQA